MIQLASNKTSQETETLTVLVNNKILSQAIQ